jgi:hypothetical protein
LVNRDQAVICLEAETATWTTSPLSFSSRTWK